MKGFPKGDPRARAAGAKGGAANGGKRYRLTMNAVQRIWPDMPRDAAYAVHAYGDARYRAGVVSKCRARKVAA